MSGQTDSHPWTGHAASFALDALDAEERAAFEAHLADCATCRADVESYRAVAAGLATVAPAREPPAGLRARIVEDARRVRPIGTRPATPLPDPIVAAPARSPRTTPWRWLAAAGIGAALISAAAWLSERDVRSDLEQRLAELTADASSREAQLAEVRADLAQRDSLLAAVLAADVATTRLAARGQQPPSARVYWNRNRGRVVIAAFDLDPAAAGRTYQLWGIADGTPVSLGLFNTTAGGTATVSLPIDPALEFQIAAVTEEPAGGSPQPTSAPFLVGTISAP